MQDDRVLKESNNISKHHLEVSVAISMYLPNNSNR